MRFNDAILGLVLIGFALVAAEISRGFPSMPGQEYGSALFPRILCVGFAICGGILVWSGVRNRATQPLLDRDPWARSASLMLRGGSAPTGICAQCAATGGITSPSAVHSSEWTTRLGGELQLWPGRAIGASEWDTAPEAARRDHAARVVKATILCCTGLRVLTVSSLPLWT